MDEPSQIDDQQALCIIGCYSRKQQTRDESDYGAIICASQMALSSPSTTPPAIAGLRNFKTNLRH